jgi:hypothetical protein
MSILAPADTPSSSFLIAALAATPIAVLLFVRLSKWAAMRIRKAPGHRVSPRRVSG